VTTSTDTTTGDGGGLGLTVIIVIVAVIGALVVIALITCLFICICVRRKKKNVAGKTRRSVQLNPLTPTVTMGTAIKHPLPDRVKPSFVTVGDPGTLTLGTLTLSPERQSARLSKITNDPLNPV